MFNKGKHTHRLKQNPVEQLFAEAWEKKCTNIYGKENGKGTLDYLLAERNEMPMGEATARDRMVAATVIQWLGSPVGQGFLKDTGIKIKGNLRNV